MNEQPFRDSSRIEDDTSSNNSEPADDSLVDDADASITLPDTSATLSDDDGANIPTDTELPNSPNSDDDEFANISKEQLDSTQTESESQQKKKKKKKKRKHSKDTHEPIEPTPKSKLIDNYNINCCRVTIFSVSANCKFSKFQKTITVTKKMQTYVSKKKLVDFNIIFTTTINLLHLILFMIFIFKVDVAVIS